MRWFRSFLRYQVGRRGAALLFFSVLDITYAFGLYYPPETNNDFYAFLGDVLPMWVWALLWAAIGVCCLINAFRVRDRVGFAAAMFVKVLWGAVALMSFVIADVDRGWVSAAIWLTAAGWVAVISSWPEPYQTSPGQVADAPGGT
jgi:hypothetical protein